MPAQQLEREREKVAVMKMEKGSLPANSSSAALVNSSNKKTVEGTGLLQPEFISHAASGHITTKQWITVAVLVYVNLINYMDRLTLAGETKNSCVSRIDFVTLPIKAVEGHV